MGTTSRRVRLTLIRFASTYRAECALREILRINLQIAA